VIIETTRVFPVLSTHGQSQRNPTTTKLQKVSWRICTSTVNDNSDILDKHHSFCHYRFVWYCSFQILNWLHNIRIENQSGACDETTEPYNVFLYQKVIQETLPISANLCLDQFPNKMCSVRKDTLDTDTCSRVCKFNPIFFFLICVPFFVFVTFLRLGHLRCR
jgi:hypothetical protein